MDKNVIEATRRQLNASRVVLKETEESIQVLEQQRQAARGSDDPLLAQAVKSIERRLRTELSNKLSHEQRGRELEALLRTMEG